MITAVIITVENLCAKIYEPAPDVTTNNAQKQ